MDILIFGVVLVLVISVVFVVHKRDKDKTKKRVRDDLLAENVKLKEWELSPINPDGPNFDQAAYDAWLQKPYKEG